MNDVIVGCIWIAEDSSIPHPRRSVSFKKKCNFIWGIGVSCVAIAASR